MAVDTFYFSRNGLFYDVINERSGEVMVELVDCVAEARNYIAELTAEAMAAEAAEQAALAAEATEYAQEQAELDAIYRAIAARYDAEAGPYDPRNRARQIALAAIDSLGRPDLEQKVAA